METHKQKNDILLACGLRNETSNKVTKSGCQLTEYNLDIRSNPSRVGTKY